MAIAIVVAFLAIRRGDVRTHSAWMTRAYAIGLGAGTQVLHLPAVDARSSASPARRCTPCSWARAGSSTSPWPRSSSAARARAARGPCASAPRLPRVRAYHEGMTSPRPRAVGRAGGVAGAAPARVARLGARRRAARSSVIEAAARARGAVALAVGGRARSRSCRRCCGVARIRSRCSRSPSAPGSVVGRRHGGDPSCSRPPYFLILVYAVDAVGLRPCDGGRWRDPAARRHRALVRDEPPTPADVIGGLAVLVATSTLGRHLPVAGERPRARARPHAPARARAARPRPARHRGAPRLGDRDPGAGGHRRRLRRSGRRRRGAAGHRERGVPHARRDALDGARPAPRRDAEPAERTPSPGIDDVRAARRSRTAHLVVDVRLEGDAATVPPAVAAAVFRIAQEARDQRPPARARRHPRRRGRAASTPARCGSTCATTASPRHPRHPATASTA